MKYKLVNLISSKNCLYLINIILTIWYDGRGGILLSLDFYRVANVRKAVRFGHKILSMCLKGP